MGGGEGDEGDEGGGVSWGKSQRKWGEKKGEKNTGGGREAGSRDGRCTVNMKRSSSAHGPVARSSGRCGEATFTFARRLKLPASILWARWGAICVSLLWFGGMLRKLWLWPPVIEKSVQIDDAESAHKNSLVVVKKINTFILKSQVDWIRMWIYRWLIFIFRSQQQRIHFYFTVTLYCS